MFCADSVVVYDRFGDHSGMYDRADALHFVPAHAVEHVGSRYLTGDKRGGVRGEKWLVIYESICQLRLMQSVAAKLPSRNRVHGACRGERSKDCPIGLVQKRMFISTRQSRRRYPGGRGYGDDGRECAG